MKLMRHTMIAAAFLLAAPAWAQTTSDIVRDLVFSEAEKRIIGDHFGVKVEDMAQDKGLPEWATKGRDDDDDDDGDEKKTDKGKGKDKSKGKSKDKGLPPGLAKRDTLPPGLQKQFDKNGRLPPGLDKRDLPDDLASKLPKRDDSQDITIVDDDIVLVDKATGVILDVLTDVITGGGANGGASGPGPQTPDGAQSDGAIMRFLKGVFGGN